MRAWGCHMVHHALYQKQNYSYAGIIESLSGAPFDVKFISFQDILDDSSILDDIDVLINVGDADTAHTGGDWWVNPHIVEAVRKFVYNGGGIIGVGEPTGHQFQGRFFQLADVFGVEEEHGLLLVMINITGMSMSISFWKRQRVLISVRARRISMHLQDLQSLFRRTKKFRWLLMNMGKDVLYISADFRIALRTTVFFIVRSCGVLTARMS